MDVKEVIIIEVVKHILPPFIKLCRKKYIIYRIKKEWVELIFLKQFRRVNDILRDLNKYETSIEFRCKKLKRLTRAMVKFIKINNDVDYLSNFKIFIIKIYYKVCILMIKNTESCFNLTREAFIEKIDEYNLL